jgi:hypothetical protein
MGGPDGPLVRQQRIMERGQGLQIDGDVSDFVTAGACRARPSPTTAQAGRPVLAGGRPARQSLVQIDFYGPNDGLNEALDDARSMLDSMDLEAPQ